MITEQEAMELNLHIRKQEINAVKELSEKIGYGNLMDIAAALWAMKMSTDGIERIMHVPTVKPCMKKKEWERTREEVLLRIEEIKSLGISFLKENCVDAGNERKMGTGRLTGYDKDRGLIVREEEWLLRVNGVITKDEMYKIMRHLAERLAEYEDLAEIALKESQKADDLEEEAADSLEDM